ncbi:penicillin-binding protein [Geobacter sp. DSM 9736]|uniref:penicillin-binding protein n=1 Tax=Geobacter sp. DSM 9736 TaxID=1277350 RepID=UPI000B50C3D4|nr:penicillin-binding transpeptidase domain-containing protein [Geobacter sp. DSM 9736]SNB47811.1 peptidoglycan synthetase FtsI [Geobacter sp. DSM 9736]
MKDGREKWARVRIRLVGGAFAFFFAITSARAFYLQVVQKDQFLKLAEKQHQKVVQLTPGRGGIYDRNNSELAVSIEMDSCFAEPRNMDDAADAASRLAPILGTSVDVLQRKLTGSKGFVWLQRRLMPDQVQRIKQLGIDGIGFVKESKRFYPHSEMASHVIGFTGMDPEGLEGIERKYDSVLLGSTGYMVTERDALGRDIALKNTVVKSASKGQSITLTLDKNIQYITEKELAKAVQSSRAVGGIAVVMEPSTGKVLAMANYPGFNPNLSDRPLQHLRNKAIVDSFEPGSTFKVFLLAAALEEHIIGAHETFNCENGSYEIGGRVIHDTHKYGTLSVSDILKYSSNIGSAKIGARLGAERLYNYLRSFGFGERSGIDLPGEVSGNLRNRNQWVPVDLATISFGQGVSATAVQLATAFSALANGGMLMKPYIVERISDSQGTVLQKFEPQVRRRVVSKETASRVAKMMEGVTAEGGTAISAAVEGYRVGGKTGTAQKVDPVTRGYSIDKRTASFIGFAPLSDPKLTIVVIVDEPKTSPYGGVVAAPAFSAIALRSLCYLNVPKDKKEKPKIVQVEAKAEVDEEDPPAAEGSITESGEGEVMPNFRMMSMRQVLRVMEQKGLNVKLLGSGRVVEQNPPPGRKIGPSDRVWVRLAPAA